MNSAFAKKLLVLAPIMAGLLLAAGCANLFKGHASVIRIEVADYKTGQPLPGVYAAWREDLDDMTYGHYQTASTNLSPSDDSGIISVSPVHGRMTGRLILSCPGYTTVYGIYSDGSLDTSDHIQPPPLPQDVFTLDDSEPCGQANGCFLVRMHK